MKSMIKALGSFFGVVIEGQTYLNLLYLLLAFPLGLFYFIFLVSGLSIGASLVIVWVGIPVLLIVFGAWYGLLIFERWMAITVLHENIPPLSRVETTGMSNWQKLKSALANPVTWKGLVYLIAKFPIGILSFVILVTFITLTASLIGAPIYYHWFNPQVNLDLGGLFLSPNWKIDTLFEALLVCLAGVFVALISLHIFNGLAWVSGKFARIMLGNFGGQSSSPAAASPQTPPPAEQQIPG